jgi:hypothetical protein
MGWSFTFWGDMNGVTDFASWQNFVLENMRRGAKLVDERDNEMNLTELENIIEALRGNTKKNALLPVPDSLSCWLDKDGNDFCSGDWS